FHLFAHGKEKTEYPPDRHGERGRRVLHPGGHLFKPAIPGRIPLPLFREMEILMTAVMIEANTGGRELGCVSECKGL
ncbi:MAG: hypothetical protein H6R19_1735, partial [Proteobacteria bacterium]|nr:hypothetical protein [Pseudomonadota bacterium]